MIKIVLNLTHKLHRILPIHSKTMSYMCERPQKLNNSLSSNMTMPSCSETYKFVFGTCFIGTLCILGIIGNTLSIFILKDVRRNKVAVLLLRALAVTDNFVLLLCFVLISILYGLIPPRDIPNNILIFIVQYINPLGYIAQFCTVWITVLIAFNRFIAICIPFKAHVFCTLTKTNIQIMCVILASFILNLPWFFQFKVHETGSENENKTVCLTNSSIGSGSLFSYIYVTGFLTVMVIVIPTVILIFVNSRLICEVKQMKRRESLNSIHGETKDDNITLVMIVIILVLLICHTPDRIILFLISIRSNVFTNLGISPCYALDIGNLLLVLNSSSNFVIYYLMRKGFRKAILVKLSCKTMRRQRKANGDEVHTLQQKVNYCSETEDGNHNSVDNSHVRLVCLHSESQV